eukprot:scaffold5357_cov80-Skeletonema_dohrnii-CCMP3373.AAC.2
MMIGCCIYILLHCSPPPPPNSNNNNLMTIPMVVTLRGGAVEDIDIAAVVSSAKRFNPPVTTIIDNAALIHSVFSEAFLVGVDGGVPTVMDLTALGGRFLGILVQSTHHVTSLLQIVNFCEFDRREDEAANLFVAS